MGRSAPHGERHAVDGTERLAAAPRRSELLHQPLRVDGVGVLPGSGRGVAQEERRRRPAERDVPQRRRVGEELPCVRVCRRGEDVGALTLFDDEAVVENHHAMGAIGGDAEIMRDEQHRGALFAPQLVDEVEDAPLHCRVEGTGGLVRDDQPRTEGDRRRDEHPLPHAAGELVRVLPCAQTRIVEAHPVEEVEHPSAAGRGIPHPMKTQDLSDLDADRPHRVERGDGVLRDETDLTAADGAQALLTPAADVDIAEEDRSALDAAAFRKEADDGVGGGGLARAGLADERDDLALSDGEVDAVDDLPPSLALRVRRPETLYFEDAHRVPLPIDWLMRFALSTTTSTTSPGRVVSHHAVAT